MKSVLVALGLLLPALLAHAGDAVTFATLDVFINLPANERLAAWQVDVDVDGRIVGIEGGDANFSTPPFYDPAALAGGHIKLAALEDPDASQSPQRPLRVATLFVALTANRGDELRATVRLVTAADPDGRHINAEAYSQWRKNR